VHRPSPGVGGPVDGSAVPAVEVVVPADGVRGDALGGGGRSEQGRQPGGVVVVLGDGTVDLRCRSRGGSDRGRHRLVGRLFGAVGALQSEEVLPVAGVGAPVPQLVEHHRPRPGVVAPQVDAADEVIRLLRLAQIPRTGRVGVRPELRRPDLLGAVPVGGHDGARVHRRGGHLVPGGARVGPGCRLVAVRVPTHSVEEPAAAVVVDALQKVRRTDRRPIDSGHRWGHPTGEDGGVGVGALDRRVHRPQQRCVPGGVGSRAEEGVRVLLVPDFPGSDPAGVAGGGGLRERGELRRVTGGAGVLGTSRRPARPRR